MGTGGSRSIRSLHATMQQVGASARVRLIAAAAQQWGVPASACSVGDGQVRHAASGRALGFGALAAAAAKVQLDRGAGDQAARRSIRWRASRSRGSIRRRNAPAQAMFGIDVRLPDMVYAAVALCPVPGGTVKSYDASKVLGRRGVQAVVPVPGGVAVVADRFWRAKQAAADLPVEWNPGAGAGTDSAMFRAAYRAALDGTAGRGARRRRHGAGADPGQAGRGRL